ncbi:alpha/beta-Hydrolases superfamily protein [Perilla frutescens var. frutescens]|nr:alpha/beta-Hydrolases superfamily protein [Perilla frutescens var. frutescens]
MLLNPREASFLELMKILFSSDDVAKRKFVEQSRSEEGFDDESLSHRIVIFVSVVVQKVLLSMAEPLAAFGSTLENWLNLVSQNGGFFALLINYLKGEVIYPDIRSSSFLSFVGNIDKRIELESEIRQEDARYYPALSIMAAKASYENHHYIHSAVSHHWKMDFVKFQAYWNDYQGKATTEAFVMEDKNNTIIVAFRGTEPFDADAWALDFDISWYDIPPLGKIHSGFLKALGLQQTQGWPADQEAGKPETAYYGIRRLLKERLQRNDRAKFIVTGHSLGGALAVLFPAVLALHQESWMLERLEAVYTFGQPRVGDERFSNYMRKTFDQNNVNYFRFVYSFDMVPRLPWDNSTLMFKHFGTCIYYNSFYQGKVVDEEPDKNYFSIIWTIPKIVNAWWELMRSFILPCVKGDVYKEGTLLRIMRMMGISLSAGISAHITPDYINSTRLGSPHLFHALPSSNANAHKTIKMH